MTAFALELMTWRPIAWHMRPEVLRTAESALIRMANLSLQFVRPEGELWLD